MYPSDEFSDLVGHDVEVLASQRSEQLVDTSSATDDVLQQSVGTEQAPQQRLHATALNAARHQRHVLAEDRRT